MAGLSRPSRSWAHYAILSGIAGSSPAMTSALGIHIPPVHRDGLAGHEIAVGGGEKDQCPEQVLRMHVALERARGNRAVARGLHVAGIFVHDRVTQREARHQRVDADAVV